MTCVNSELSHNGADEMETSEAALSTRSQRRRQRTRARIVEAAERLMRERGVEAVTIQDITEAADVGHGTFYCHFESKAEVLRPLIDSGPSASTSRSIGCDARRRDPALRLATGVRIALRAIANDPLWNWYVFRSGTPFRQAGRGDGAPPVEDMNRGMASGRFQVRNLRATWSFIDGAMIGVLTAWNRAALGEDAAEITAELVLRSLGVSPEEAARIAREPLELS